MQYIKSINGDEGAIALAERLSADLLANRKVLWLIPGGSNIPIAVKVMKMVRGDVGGAGNVGENSVGGASENLPTNSLSNLTVSLTDERYGPVGHKDSNWQQLTDSGFDFAGIKTIPVLNNLSLEDTVSQWGKKIEAAYNSADIIVGQFGIGPDGHIAGILPHSPAVKDENATAGYTAGPFTRITLTPWTLARITVAYAFAFGESKREAMKNLVEEKLSLDEQPAQILKKIPEAYLYGDCVVEG